MILSDMEMYNECTNTLDQHKVQYFTFNKPQNREIRAIFKGVAEDIEVRFELQRKKKRIGQCYNCQRFGHSAYNCKADPVCRHCAGKHVSRT
ncbi:hypothetical protein JTB14_038015 [Gonioctena quinquepunctata]|nr:hypothetical protein JTB14_038015 [Gonioctena quinquepunctata]